MACGCDHSTLETCPQCDFEPFVRNHFFTGKLMGAADKRAHLWENSKRLHAGLKQLGFTLGTDEPQSAIIAVIMPELQTGAAMWEALLDEGLYVNLARPPATPAGMTLLRCSLCSEHSSAQVDEILGMFRAAGQATGCIPA